MQDEEQAVLNIFKPLGQETNRAFVLHHLFRLYSVAIISGEIIANGDVGLGSHIIGSNALLQNNLLLITTTQRLPGIAFVEKLYCLF